MKSIFAALLSRRPARPKKLELPSRRRGRPGQNYWAVMCDVDHFRAYNDIYGQAAGDEVLRRVSDALSRNCRGDDRVFSRCGEEFVLVVPGESLERASARAERHRDAVERLQIPHQGSPFGIVTISMGLATIVSGGRSATAEALDQADQALCRAKRAGRNRVVGAGLALA